MIVCRCRLIFVLFLDVIWINVLNEISMPSFHDVISIFMCALQLCLMLIMHTILYINLSDFQLLAIRLEALIIRLLKATNLILLSTFFRIYSE